MKLKIFMGYMLSMSCISFLSHAMGNQELLYVKEKSNRAAQKIELLKKECDALCLKAAPTPADASDAHGLRNLIRERDELRKNIEATAASIAIHNDIPQSVLDCIAMIESLDNAHFKKIQSKLAAMAQLTQQQPSEEDMQALLDARFAQTFSAELLELPESLSEKAVHQPYVYAARDFACCYNAIFNACNVEVCCGYRNPYEDYSFFKLECLKILRTLNKDPLGAANDLVTDVISKPMLTAPFHNLVLIKNRVLPFSQWKVPDDEADRAGTLMVSTIQDYLRKATKPCTIVHFFCFIHEIKHCLVMTLVQNSTGRGLYIFDNDNKFMHAATKKFVDFLCDSFEVSPKNAFVGPEIPDGWSSVLACAESDNSETPSFILRKQILRLADPVVRQEYFNKEMARWQAFVERDQQKKSASFEAKRRTE